MLISTFKFSDQTLSLKKNVNRHIAKPMKNKLIYAFFCLGLFGGCEVDTSVPETKVWGYTPIYGAAPLASDVQLQPAKSIGKKGKLYFKDNFLLLINEGEGVHFVNNADPDNPINYKFLAAPGIRNIAIKDSVLYLEMGTSLMSVLVIDFDSIQVLENKANFFEIQKFPSEVGVQFECYDPENGQLIGWRKDSITDPQCYR